MKNGYAVISVGRSDKVLVHRAAFFVAFGRWPTPHGLHRCDNPACLKAVADERGPAHIYEGTQSRNMRDCSARGRSNLLHVPDAKVDEVRRRIARGDTYYAIEKALGLPNSYASRVARGIIRG